MASAEIASELTLASPEQKKTIDQLNPYLSFRPGQREAVQEIVGRTTRGPDDFSQTFVLDSNFGWFVNRCRAAFKEDFLYSIRSRRPC